MKIITWNIRGMNNIHKLDVIQNFVRKQKDDIMVIQETKMDKVKAENLKSFKNYSIMPSSSKGALGGTLIMWKHSPFIGSLMDVNKHLIAVKIQSPSQDNFYYVVNVYTPNNNARIFFWDSLSKIKSSDYNGKWLFLGDFNVPLYEHEKKVVLQAN